MQPDRQIGSDTVEESLTGELKLGKFTVFASHFSALITMLALGSNRSKICASPNFFFNFFTPRSCWCAIQCCLIVAEAYANFCSSNMSVSFVLTIHLYTWWIFRNCTIVHFVSRWFVASGTRGHQERLRSGERGIWNQQRNALLRTKYCRTQPVQLNANINFRCSTFRLSLKVIALTGKSNLRSLFITEHIWMRANAKAVVVFSWKSRPKETI